MAGPGDDITDVATPSEERWLDPSLPNDPVSFLLRFVGFDRDVLDVAAGAAAVSDVLRERGNRVAVGPADGEVDGEMSFDVVVMDDVLDRIEDPVATLRAVRRVVRPGGSVVLSAPNGDHIDVRLAALGATSPSSGTERPGAVTRAVLTDWLTEAGLRVVELQRVFGPMLSSPSDESGDLPTGTVAELLLEVEAETLAFVVRAKRVEDDLEAAELERRLLDAEEMLLRAQRAAERADAEMSRVAAGAERAHDRAIELMVELDAVNADRQRLRDELDAIRSATTTGDSTLRRAYGRLRDAWGGSTR